MNETGFLVREHALQSANRARIGLLPRSYDLSVSCDECRTLGRSAASFFLDNARQTFEPYFAVENIASWAPSWAGAGAYHE
ncbi:MAG: hypothetical protein H6888_10205 [Nitratireductor sp.]|nr:hypothetical protein [Nitratireductor sp.]